MKIKIIKIKTEATDQEFDSSAFISGLHTIISTHAELKKEENGLYWHVLFTYESKEAWTPVSPKKAEKTSRRSLNQEIFAFVNNHPTASGLAKNGVLKNIDYMPDMAIINDFERLRNVGKRTLVTNKLFFEELLDIIYKY